MVLIAGELGRISLLDLARRVRILISIRES